jgi:hypothetical protein
VTRAKKPATTGDECRPLTIREQFAASALTGMLAYSHINPQVGNWVENASPKAVACDAIRYADALIAELAKEAEAKP